MHLFVYFWATHRNCLASLGLLRQTVFAAESVLISHSTIPPMRTAVRTAFPNQHSINSSAASVGAIVTQIHDHDPLHKHPRHTCCINLTLFTHTWFVKFQHTTRPVLLPQEALLPALEALSPDQFEWAMSLVHARYPGLPTGPGEEMQFDITCLDSLALRQLMDLTQACARAAKVNCYLLWMLSMVTL